MSTIWEAYPWRFGAGFCIVKSFISEMTAYASVLTITAFTVDRYVAICHPLRSQTISSLARAVKIIVFAWCLACCCALPYPAHTRLFHELQDPCTGEVSYCLWNLHCTVGRWGVLRVEFAMGGELLFVELAMGR